VPDNPAIVSFRSAVEAQQSRPEPARIVSGAPQLTVWNHYSDPSQQFFAGVWAATRGCWRIHYTEHEFCHLLEGRVRLASGDGQRWEFTAGDSFIVPAGFSGTWEVIEDCRKLYAIFEARAGE
jgi:uncharacterized cupin superfamily protein